MGAGSVKGLVIQIGGDTSKLEQSLKEANTSIKNFSKELKGVNTLLKFDSSNIVMSTQKQKLLKETISETEKKLQALKKAQDDADYAMATGTQIDQENYRALEREIAATEQKLAELKKEASNWTKVGDALEGVGNKISNISGKIEDLGGKLTKTLTVPIVGAATVAIKSASDFESAWTGVTKTVDGTEEQMASLRQGIIDMSEKIPSSTTEIAAVAEAAGQLGIKADDILNFTKVMIDLGNSTNLSAGDAASALAKFANITQMSAKDYDKLGSAIVDLGNNFATTEADIVEMAMRLVGAGKQVGLTEGQILGLATALSSVGIEAEMGGSAVSKAMVKMQNAVEISSTKLDNVTKKTGKSLHDLELMSTNDTKGFKELAGSLDMTTTQLKNIVNAGVDLENFAKISGKTTEEFKKQWKDDAVGALTAFIKGLGDAESKGDSAITMLTEMGLTETRLRDSLLRAANAGNLFNDAINTGTKAWDTNTALTNEANKRYGTFASQVEIAKNKAQNLAASFGEKLLPHAIKLLDKLNELVEWFGNLSEGEQENIIKIGLFVAAIGPAISIIGKFGNAIGTTISTVGKLSTKIGDITTKTGGLGGAFSSLSATVGISITAITIAIAALEWEMNEIIKVFEDYNKETYGKSLERGKAIKNETDSYLSLVDASQKNMEAQLSQIENTQKLKDELDSMVDANGKIKEGYENRAKFIVGELKEATGVEIDIIDGQIKKYGELSDSIDKALQKQKLESIMNKMKNDYDEAVTHFDSFKKAADEAWDTYYSAISDPAATKETLDNLKNVAESADKAYSNCAKTIAEYEYSSELVLTKGADALEEITNRVSYGITGTLNDTAESVKNAVTTIGGHLDFYKGKYQETQDEAYRIQAESYEKQLENLATHMAEMTSTTENLSQEEIDAWSRLASSSYDAYRVGLEALPEETKKKVEDATGVIIGETPTTGQAAKDLGDIVIENFDKSADAKKVALDEITKYMNGLSDDEKRRLLKEIGIQDADIVLDELNKGDLSESHGKNILDGLYKGLSNKTLTSKITGIATGLANTVNKAFSSIWQINSPSKYMTKLMEYYLAPISNVMMKQEKPLKDMSEKFANSINEGVVEGFSKEGLTAALDVNTMSSNKTYQVNANFYSQHLSEAEMNNAFVYLNKKLGMIGG